MYFTPEMFSPSRWEIVADALKFRRMHFDVLSNSYYFEEDKGGGAYGYMCAHGQKGLVIMRNPSQKPVPFVLSQDKIAKMFGEEGGCSVREIYPKTYNAVIFGAGAGGFRCNLAPQEVKIIEVERAE
jgi:hypothetical protein